MVGPSEEAGGLMAPVHGMGLLAVSFDPPGALVGVFVGITIGALAWGAGWGLEHGAAALWRWLHRPRRPRDRPQKGE